MDSYISRLYPQLYLIISPFFQATRTSCLGQQRPNVLERQQPISVLSADMSRLIFAEKKTVQHPKWKIISCNSCKDHRFLVFVHGNCSWKFIESPLIGCSFSLQTRWERPSLKRTIRPPCQQSERSSGCMAQSLDFPSRCRPQFSTNHKLETVLAGTKMAPKVRIKTLPSRYATGCMRTIRKRSQPLRALGSELPQIPSNPAGIWNAGMLFLFKEFQGRWYDVDLWIRHTEKWQCSSHPIVATQRPVRTRRQHFCSGSSS